MSVANSAQAPSLPLDMVTQSTASSSCLEVAHMLSRVLSLQKVPASRTMSSLPSRALILCREAALPFENGIMEY